MEWLMKWWLSLMSLGWAWGALAQEPEGRVLWREDFGRAEALAAWSSGVGASVGEGPESSAAWDEGALRLEGGADTRRWLALERPAELGDARWIRVSGRMRVDGVRAEGARYVNSNLFVRFDTGQIQVTPVLLGTQPWSSIASRFLVPPGAKGLTVGCFLSLPGKAWFDDVQVEGLPDPWREEADGDFVYRLLPGDSIPDVARAFNRESLRMMREFFGEPGAMPIVFWKYPNLDLKEEYSGRRGNAHLIGRDIHSIWPSDRHEIVHRFARAWGDPPAILGEGLAVHLSGAWQNRPVREFAAEVLRSGAWIALPELLDTGAFRRKPDLATYSIAGAFIAWLLETEGQEKLRQLYSSLKNTAAPEENARLLKSILGRSPEELDRELRAWLD